jgi:hypothetical protein
MDMVPRPTGLLPCPPVVDKRTFFDRDIGELVHYTSHYGSNGEPDRVLLCIITKKYKNSQYIQLMSVETGTMYNSTAGWLRKIEDED